jgi:nicotinate-nucleotide pyrophosphorylase (carboxylating)
MAAQLGSLGHLLVPGWKATIASWLQEDCPSFDYGGFVVGDTPETATLYGKSKACLLVIPFELTAKGVLAGTPFFEEVFSQLGCRYALSRVPP